MRMAHVLFDEISIRLFVAGSTLAAYVETHVRINIAQRVLKNRYQT